jgi:hypothetical protein
MTRIKYMDYHIMTIYIKQFIMDSLKNFPDTYYHKMRQSWGKFGINIFDKMDGGSKEYEIKVKDNVFKVRVNRPKELNVDPNQKFMSSSGDKFQYSFITQDGSKDCGSLIINKERSIAYIFMVYSHIGCVVIKSTGDDLKARVGTTMMEIMMEWCRMRGVTKIYLDDESTYTCLLKDKNDILPAINLSKAHTMTHGYPWYYNFGFRFVDSKEEKTTAYNKELYNRLHTKDVDKESIQSVVRMVLDKHLVGSRESKNTEFDAVVQLYDENKDKLFGEFIKALQTKHCRIFAWMQDQLYQGVGYKPYMSFYMLKKL